MFPAFDILVTFANAVAVGAMLTYCYGILQRWTQSPVLRDAANGILYGVAAVVTIAQPIQITPSVEVDMRSLFIALAFAHFGTVGGVITMVLSLGFGRWIGGDLALIGTFGMLLAACAGLFWRHFVKPQLGPVARADAVLGLMVSLTLLVVFVEPDQLQRSTALELHLMMVPINVLGTLIIGSLQRREIRLIMEEERLAEAAATDPLTNLPNRRSTEQVIRDLCAYNAEIEGVALLYFDIDHFKRINDGYGHSFGDLVLQEVTSRVKTCLRAGDHFARHGGDEFLVLQTRLTRHDALATAERCRAAVACLPIRNGIHPVDVTISIGVHWSPMTESFSTLLANADEALYAAKSSGRNRVAEILQAA